MATKSEFINLSDKQQRQASAQFFNAGVGDGYLYELDLDGGVLCRQRSDAVQSQPRSASIKTNQGSR